MTTMRERRFFGAVMMAAVLGLGACGDENGTTGTTSGSGAAGGTGGTGGASTAGTGGAETTGSGGTGAAATTSAGGGGAETTGSGGTGGMTGDDLAALSDEFDAAQTLSEWKILSEELGLEAPYELLDINATVAGKLTVVPTVSAWFEDLMATFVYKEVSGDFVVEVDVGAFDKDTQSGPPNQVYNSAGMLIRDPASALGEQNWLMYNIGYQADYIGVEGKATRSSESELHLFPTGGAHTGRLRMCRTGNVVRMLRRLPGAVDWTQTHSFPESFPATPAFTLPDTVQVGMIDNAYLVADLRAEFEYIRFARVMTEADCTKELPPP